MLTLYLKLTRSIQIELVPGSEFYPDKKTFDWHVTSYDKTSVILKIDFADPEYISSGGVDTLKLKIANTEAWMRSSDSKY